MILQDQDKKHNWTFILVTEPCDFLTRNAYNSYFDKRLFLRAPKAIQLNSIGVEAEIGDIRPWYIKQKLCSYG